MIVGTSKKRLDFTNTHTPSISKSSINKSPNYSPSLRKLKKGKNYLLKYNINILLNCPCYSI